MTTGGHFGCSACSGALGPHLETVCVCVCVCVCLSVYVCLSVSVCVCVGERKRERERENDEVSLADDSIIAFTVPYRVHVLVMLGRLHARLRSAAPPSEAPV